MSDRKLELIPDVKEIGKPFFDTEEEYQKFRASYYEDMKPELDRQREARRLSEEAARRHFVY
jgi:hypothetical protein